jgi:GT2 family glycosyltransferase
MSAVPRLSLVFATYDRPALAERLMRQLDRQTLPREAYEVVAVDDGSAGDVAPRLARLDVGYRLEVVSQENCGAAAARDRGIIRARGPVVVVVDDDMQVPPGFLEAHLAYHAPGVRRAVLGRIRPDPALESMPLFERYHARMLDRWVAEVQSGRTRVQGTAVCTGNVSFRRVDYFAVGGFDRTLRRSEDADLGLRLEKAGVELVFADEAYTIHGSDHTSLAVWLHRAFLYGVHDLRIARKHSGLPSASPWRFLSLVNPVSRPVLLATLLVPSAARRLARLAISTALALDRRGAEGVAIAGTTLVYGMEYYRGVRAECGSTLAALSDLRRHRRLCAAAGPES